MVAYWINLAVVIFASMCILDIIVEARIVNKRYTRDDFIGLGIYGVSLMFAVNWLIQQ